MAEISQSDPVRQGAEAPPRPKPVERGNPTVLVVEDESLVAMDIQNKLRALGFNAPEFVASGEDAVARAEALRPQLVLMDIRLRGAMDGIAAAAEIQKRHPIPVVFLTAYGDRDTLARARATDPYGFLLKPFDERDLRTTIEIALHRHRFDLSLQAALADVSRHAKRAETLAALGLRALRETNLDRLLAAIAESVSEGLGVECVAVLEARGAELRVAAATSACSCRVSDVFPDAEGEPYKRALHSAGPVLVQTSGLDREPEVSFPGTARPASALILATPGERKPWGLLAAYDSPARTFVADETAFVQSAANILATAIGRRDAQGLILELSTPILPVAPRMLMTPLIGAIDLQRMRQLTDQLLRAVRDTRARVVVVDLTGAAGIDTYVADELLKMARAVSLAGARPILTGITTEVAAAAVHLGLDFRSIDVIRDLQEGIEAARRYLRLPV